ncbi:flagella basal body P-ring formation protein FlgA [Caulobacter rhizosphaerae]|jgi:flagella basal body P-ring formation protein FlgA|uniref:Flagella basal body P-ring formation protein FlgA n=1 Tax=Caulobacter rhizosphaerae TaxID=2010972 RepID=A0ABU1N7G7_9CAUL|nr:flagellar basal body P-ring formation chaperone FlgA [Caulobacter rhizosphaerae]MDR6533985.1 flagella basal body P-ring formation protein FlgA [Caulobacter rhizosphaerae]
MKAFVPALAALLIATPALAGQAVSLRSDTTDADGRITLGELFDGAGAASDVVVANRVGPSAVLEAGAVQIAARRAGLDWANSNGVRRIIVRQGSDSGVAGASRGNVEVLAYARSLATGELVQPEDLVWIKAAAGPSDAPRDADDLIGMTVKRPLRQGAAASLRDVSTPQVIKAGDIVAVTYEDDGVALTLQGKAMSAGAIGESLMVQNTASKKIIETVVTGPGSTAVGPQAMRLKANRNNTLRYAAR